MRRNRVISYSFTNIWPKKLFQVVLYQFTRKMNDVIGLILVLTIRIGIRNMGPIVITVISSCLVNGQSLYINSTPKKVTG